MRNSSNRLQASLGLFGELYIARPVRSSLWFNHLLNPSFILIRVQAFIHFGAMQWHFEELISSKNAFSLIILNRPLKSKAMMNRLWMNGFYQSPRKIIADVRMCADGGANQLYDYDAS